MDGWGRWMDGWGRWMDGRIDAREGGRDGQVLKGHLGA